MTHPCIGIAPITRAMEAALLISAAALLVSPAWANAYREKGKPVQVAGKAMTVTPSRDWNQLSSKPGKKAETWTLDGEQLNDVTWFGRIEPGEPLIRERSKKRKPLPKFGRATLLVEVPELVEATYRSYKGIAEFAVTTTRPDRFLDHDGIRFTYAYVDNDALPRNGEARAAIIGGLLYMVTFDAPRIAYFERLLDAVHELTNSARLSDAPVDMHRPTS
jgi:hypothetical protein